MNYNLSYEVNGRELTYDDSNVLIRTGTSLGDLKLAKKVIGTTAVKCLIHYRCEREIVYQTKLFLDDNNTLFIDGGITSGYGGTGPSAFKELLVHLGIDDEQAEYIAKKDTQQIEKGTLTIDIY